MALPHEHCAASEVCCDSLFNLAASIRDIAFDAVECCAVVDCDLPPLVSYVSMGTQISDPAADYLVVTLTSVGPVQASSPNALPIHRATFQVKLLETGWPMPQGDGADAIIPMPDLYENVSRHSMAHGEAMYRALANAVGKGQLCSSGCYQRVDALQPIEPSGGTTGWVTYVTVGVF